VEQEEPLTGREANHAEVPWEIKEALRANEPLRLALAQARMPQRFSAMVLGLATLKQLGESRK